MERQEVIACQVCLFTDLKLSGEFHVAASEELRAVSPAKASQAVTTASWNLAYVSIMYEYTYIGKRSVQNHT